MEFYEDLYWIEDVLDFERFDRIDAWRGAYAIGLLSNPIWLTVSSQQNRAADLAINLVNKIAENPLSLSRKEQVIRVAVVGAGIAGMVFSYCLHSYKSDRQNFTFGIDVFEQHDGICPIQRGCQTRRIHPTLQYWPYVTKEDSFSIPELSGTEAYEALKWEGGVSAGELAAKISKEYFKNYNSYAKKVRGGSEINIFQGVDYLKISRIGAFFELAVNGQKIVDKLGNLKLESGLLEKYDVVVLATGFGVERSYFGKNGVIPSRPYWRNDSLGQFNLNNEPHRYLISGNGDGAVSDVLRAIFIDYKPDELLSAIINSNIQQIVHGAFNVTKKKVDEEGMGECLRYFIKVDLARAFESADSLSILHSLWRGDNKNTLPYKNSWIYTDPVFKILCEVLIRPRIKRNVEVISHFKDSDDLAEVVNNPRVTFYNKFLFYSAWALGALKIKSGPPEDVSASAYIGRDSVLIRHGADALLPVKGVLSANLFEKYEKVSKSKLVPSGNLTERYFDNYRKGVRANSPFEE